MMSKHWLSIGSVAVAVVLFFAVNIFSSAALTRWRVDLTENNLYTLSAGTRSILAGLDEPITLRLFRSRDISTRLPGIAPYARRVEDLLREYERHAAGGINLEIIDPEPFSEEEDQAQRYGVRSIPVNDGGDPLYFGLVGTNAVDDSEVIPFFSPQQETLVEYELSRLIHQLDQAEQPVVGLVSSLPLKAPAVMGQAGRQSWLIVDQIEKLFTVKSIDPGQDRIPDDVDVLMVVHPSDLGPGMLYAIDQFVLSGGHALVFVDPYMEAQGRGPGAGASDLEPLFTQWGVELLDGKIAADMQLAERVRYEQNQRQVVGEFPVWLNVPPDRFSADDVVTANLDNVFLATPGVLSRRDGAAVEFSPLIQSSSRATTFDAAVINEASSPAAIIEAYQPGSERLTLAARISGPAETAYPEGPPAPAGDNASDEGQMPESAATAREQIRSTEAINVIVVADVDLLHEQFWARRQNLLGNQFVVASASNADLVVNALENLTGSNELISVRSRGESSRPFTRVAEIRRDAELQYRRKEQQLLDRLEQAEQALLELEQGRRGDQGELMLSREQQQEIEQFRREKVRIRQELREVQHQLRKDIEILEGWVKFINIGLLPLVITVGAAAVGIRRARSRKR